MSSSSGEHERIPEQVSVEFSPELYRAILQIIQASRTGMSAEQVFELLENHLSETVSQTISEATGVATPFPQGVEVELQVAQEIDDDDDAVRESIKQGLRDALHGDVLTEEEFWKAVGEDE